MTALLMVHSGRAQPHMVSFIIIDISQHDFQVEMLLDPPIAIPVIPAAAPVRSNLPIPTTLDLRLALLFLLVVAAEREGADGHGEQEEARGEEEDSDGLKELTHVLC